MFGGLGTCRRGPHCRGERPPGQAVRSLRIPPLHAMNGPCSGAAVALAVAAPAPAVAAAGATAGASGAVPASVGVGSVGSGAGSCSSASAGRRSCFALLAESDCYGSKQRGLSMAVLADDHGLHSRRVVLHERQIDVGETPGVSDNQALQVVGWRKSAAVALCRFIEPPCHDASLPSLASCQKPPYDGSGAPCVLPERVL